MTRALVASTLAAVALAVLPSGALAQDAGGNQYDDPLSGTPSSPSTPSTPSTPPSTGSTASAGGTGTSPSGAGTASPTTPTTGATTPAAVATAPGRGEIPRTGFPVGWLAFSGFLALGGGFALRRAAGFQGV